MSSPQNRTNAKFKLNFYYSAQPLIILTDIVSIYWVTRHYQVPPYFYLYQKLAVAFDIGMTATKVENNGPKVFSLGYRFKMNSQNSTYY